MANAGCNGGWQYKALAYYTTSNAILEADYKYTATDGTCAYATKPHSAAKTTGAGYINVTPNDKDAMKAALALTPLSISICALKKGFSYYESGIYDDAHCGTQLDHAVMVVGWGVENGVEFWNVRNSWGTGWGEAGYMRVAIVDG